MFTCKFTDRCPHFFQVSRRCVSREIFNPIRHDSWIIPHYIFRFDFWEKCVLFASRRKPFTSVCQYTSLKRLKSMETHFHPKIPTISTTIWHRKSRRRRNNLRAAHKLLHTDGIVANQRAVFETNCLHYVTGKQNSKQNLT